MSESSRTPLYRESWLRKIILWWVRNRWADVLIAAVSVALWLEAGRRDWIPCALTEVDKAQRQVLYQTAMSISATMGGFTLTSVSILVNLMRTPLTAIERLLPAGDKEKVGDVVIGVLPSLAASFMVSTVGLLIDVHNDLGRWWIEAALIVAMTAGMLGLFRVTWVVRRLLAASNS